MPTDDKQILVTGQGPVPADALIPGNGQIKPKAMNAIFDGTNSVGDFMPTLEIVSDAGIVVARVAASTVLSGNSAEVTWAPFLEEAVAATGGGTAHACHIALDYATPSGSVTIPNGGTLMTIASFDTDDPASYVQVDANTWQIPNVPQVIGGFVVEQSAAVVTPAVDARIVAFSGGHVPFGPFVPSGTRFLQTWFGYALQRNIELQNNWVAYAAGGGVRNYSLTVTYFAVY